YEATWRGRRFTVVDTGGWEPGARGLAARVSAQAEVAAAAADAVVLVIDSTVGATEADLAAARVLRRSAKPVVLAATKVDDTGGVRRRVRTASGAEFYASVRTSHALADAEVGLVLLDASQPLSEQDQRICGAVVDAGRALVLAFNKWDLVDDDRRVALERE